MLVTTANRFIQNLTVEVEKCINNHEVLKVKGRNGKDFIVLGAEDWQAIEETLFLNHIPGLVDSIQQAKNESVDLGTPLEELEW